MSVLNKIIGDLIEEGIAARAHFQVWWALRSLALPKYYDVMNQPDYVDFFHASNAAHYKMFFVALGNIYDRDDNASGIQSLRRVLDEEGYGLLKDFVEVKLFPNVVLVKKAKNIRNMSVAHRPTPQLRKDVYNSNDVTPNQLRDLIDNTCAAINYVAGSLGISNLIFEGNRLEDATIKMLRRLEGRET